jgi:hypothetical protein
MRKLQTFSLVATLSLSLFIAPSVQAKAKVTKPSAPTVVSVTSSAPKKGKVNVTVTISLPVSNGGSTITGSKVSAGGKSCTIKKLKTSCTIKGIKNGKSLSVTASSRNKKGFGTKSSKITYRAGGPAYANGPAGASGSSSLTFNTKNAVGVALTSSGQSLRGFRNAVSSSSNLVVTDAAGTVSNAIASGSASISKFMIAPNGNLYVVFQSPTELVSGGGKCLLASVDKATGVPTCIDNSLQSISWNALNRNSPPIQFDSYGAIYYSGTASNGKTVLRMFKDGQSIDLINDNINVNMFMVVPSGGAIVSGRTTSTGTSWVRRINSNGGLRTFESTGSQNISTYADGNIYYAVWGPSDFGIKRYLVSSDSLDSHYWISGNISGGQPETRNDASQLCSEADRPANMSFCGWYGTNYKSVHSPIGGKTFIIAGTSSENGTLTQVFPSLAAPQISIKKISLALTLGGGIAITGLNASNQNSLIYYNTASGTETLLMPPENEIELYHMAYNASTNKIMFDGLRFSDNKYVFGQVDLATNQVNIFSTLPAKWEDFQGFQ